MKIFTISLVILLHFSHSSYAIDLICRATTRMAYPIFARTAGQLNLPDSERSENNQLLPKTRFLPKISAISQRSVAYCQSSARNIPAFDLKYPGDEQMESDEVFLDCLVQGYEMIKINVERVIDAKKSPYFVVGNTGSGKTLSVLQLLGVPIKYKGVIEGRAIYDVDIGLNPEKYKEFEGLVGCTARESETFYPRLFETSDGMFFWDCPGFKDGRGHRTKLAVDIMVEYLIRHHGNGRFLYIMDENVLHEKDDTVNKIMEDVYGLIVPKYTEDEKSDYNLNSVVWGVTKLGRYADEKTVKEVLKNLNKKLEKKQDWLKKKVRDWAKSEGINDDGPSSQSLKAESRIYKSLETLAPRMLKSHIVFPTPSEFGNTLSNSSLTYIKKVLDKAPVISRGCLRPEILDTQQKGKIIELTSKVISTAIKLQDELDELTRRILIQENRKDRADVVTELEALKESRKQSLMEYQDAKGNTILVAADQFYVPQSGFFYPPINWVWFTRDYEYTALDYFDRVDIEYKADSGISPNTENPKFKDERISGDLAHKTKTFKAKFVSGHGKPILANIKFIATRAEDTEKFKLQLKFLVGRLSSVEEELKRLNQAEPWSKKHTNLHAERDSVDSKLEKYKKYGKTLIALRDSEFYFKDNEFENLREFKKICGKGK